eukprot:scaffold288761_cov28-Tisochrysis_lutea.AAC.1
MGFEFTAEDARWLAEVQHRKMLDARVRVLGVPARHPQTGTPQVLSLYPLRTTALEQRPAGSRGCAAPDHRCHGRSKWTSEAPVPWVNLYWLVDPKVSRDVGRLEHLGYISVFCSRLAHDECAAAQQLMSHNQYGAARWEVLSEADKAYAQGEGYYDVLRCTGVGGLRYPNQIKCLHTHYAHYLATGKSVVGSWVQEVLDAGAASEMILAEKLLGDHEEWKAHIASMGAPLPDKDVAPLAKGLGGAQGIRLKRHGSSTRRGPKGIRWWKAAAMVSAVLAVALAASFPLGRVRGGHR